MKVFFDTKSVVTVTLSVKGTMSQKRGLVPVKPSPPEAPSLFLVSNNLFSPSRLPQGNIQLIGNDSFEKAHFFTKGEVNEFSRKLFFIVCLLETLLLILRVFFDTDIMSYGLVLWEKMHSCFIT